MTPKHATNYTLRFSAYTPLVLEVVDEEQVQALAQGGVHYAILGYDDFFTLPRDKQLRIIGWCAHYGVEVILHDTNLLVDYSETSRENYDHSKVKYADWYRNLPNFAGNHLVDEPGTAGFAALGRSVEDYVKDFPGKIPWINLLPMYANNKQLAGGAWMEAIAYYDTPATPYQLYLDEYIAKVPTDYIAVDIYPCHHRNGIKVTYPGYIRNIEMVADACRKSGRAFWVCIQSCTWSPKNVRIPDAADMRWQVYTMLSYGVTNFIHYVYAGREGHYGTPLDTNGRKAVLWQPCKDLADELARLSPVYGTYRSLGAFSHNCTEVTPYLQMDSQYKDVTAISEIVCEDALLVGCFAQKNGNGSAFILVNMSDLVLEKTLEIKLKITGTRVTAFPEGQPVVLEPAEGYYRFSLTCGSGVFVTVV
jgi:hypothetical protein